MRTRSPEAFAVVVMESRSPEAASSDSLGHSSVGPSMMMQRTTCSTGRLCLCLSVCLFLPSLLDDSSRHPLLPILGF